MESQGMNYGFEFILKGKQIDDNTGMITSI